MSQKYSNNFTIVEFWYYGRMHCDKKCIQTSTNMPGIGLETKQFCMYGEGETNAWKMRNLGISFLGNFAFGGKYLQF